MKTKEPLIVISESLNTRLNAFIRLGKYSSFFIICDSHTFTYCIPELVSKCPALQNAEIIELEPGEDSKDISVIAHIWQTLTDFGADKNSLVINLGGGVVSDTGGFAASTFKRGIPFINIPTSLLAMADASVGGKTGINFAGIKNHIGTITPPEAVFICTSFLATLPYAHMVNGFAEILKIALVKDKAFFKKISGLVIDNSFNDLAIIKRSIALKAAVVKKDPNEKGLRKILNFGHTVGHAIESLSHQTPDPLLHGEAIAIGMVIEAHLCFTLKRITKAEFETILESLLINFSFPALDKKDLETFYTYFKQDKKHSSGTFKLALLKGIGRCEPEVKITLKQLQKSIDFYNTSIANAAAL